MNPDPASDLDFDDARVLLDRLRQTLAAVIVGQDPLIDDLIVAVMAGGHALLEGLPGLGKTHLAKAMAASLGWSWGRVQCTPDLMPADITGSEIYLGASGGAGDMQFRPGPLFAQLVLVDEINRATPRTQSALLEAMQERQVTHAGTVHRLPAPFCVLATQNPIELEGTFPLPEAQLDRFMVKLLMPYPGRDALLRVLDVSLDAEPADALAPVAEAAAIERVQMTCRSVLLGQRCRAAAVDLVLAAQPGADEAGAGSGRAHLRHGASPRALQALVRGARVCAVMAGRSHVDLDDLERMARPVLRHRLLLTLEAELDGQGIEPLLDRLIAAWKQAH